MTTIGSFLAGAFEHTLNVLYARVLQRQPALLDLLLSSCACAAFHAGKSSFFAAAIASSSESSRTRGRAAQLFRLAGARAAWQTRRRIHISSSQMRPPLHRSSGRRSIARSVVCPPPKKEQVDAQRCEGRQRHIVGRLEVAHLLHGGRRRGQAEVLGNKVGIHVDPRGDLCDHVGSVEPLERLAAVGKLSFATITGRTFPMLPL